MVKLYSDFIINIYEMHEDALHAYDLCKDMINAIYKRFEIDLDEKEALDEINEDALRYYIKQEGLVKEVIVYMKKNGKEVLKDL